MRESKKVMKLSHVVRTSVPSFYVNASLVKRDMAVRFCKYKGCGAKLSVYNIGSGFCHAHKDAAFKLEDDRNDTTKLIKKVLGERVK